MDESTVCNFCNCPHYLRPGTLIWVESIYPMICGTCYKDIVDLYKREDQVIAQSLDWKPIICTGV